jgi:hypothetical protein
MNEKLLEGIKVIENMPDPDINSIADAQPVLHSQ